MRPRQWSFSRAVFVYALAGMFSVASGCRRAPPPLLFRADAAPSGSPFSDTVQIADAAPITTNTEEPIAIAATPVAGEGSTLTVDGVVVRAPVNERFVQYLSLDADHDGDHDVAVLRARADGALVGVAFYRREPEGFTAVAVRGDSAPPDARCTDVLMRSTSPRSVVVSYRCPAQVADAGASLPAVGDRAAEHVVVSLAPTPSVRTRVTELLPALAATALDVSVDALDRDGDGHDDVVVRVGARRPGERPEQAARAHLVYFDREGGLARETSEPEASFARLAAQARSLATRRRAADAVSAVERIVRLRRALCAETGTARVRVNTEVGVRCGDSPGLRAAAESLARAYLAMGELPAAFALTRPESASELGVASSERLLTDLRRAARPEAGVVARPGPFIGSAGLEGQAPYRGSALLLSPAAAPSAVDLRGPVTAHVELATLTSTTGEPGSIADVLAHSPDGARVVQGVYETCEGLVVALCPAGDNECIFASPSRGIPAGAVSVRLTDLPSASHTASCLRTPDAVAPLARARDARVLGYGREGPVLSLRGRLYRAGPGAVGGPINAGQPLGGPFPPGSAVSASGMYALVPSAEGLFVRDGAGRWHLWAPSTLAGRYGQMTDLAISDDARTAVGFYGSQLWVIERPAAPAVVAPQARPGHE